MLARISVYKYIHVIYVCVSVCTCVCMCVSMSMCVYMCVRLTVCGVINDVLEGEHFV